MPESTAKEAINYLRKYNYTLAFDWKSSPLGNAYWKRLHTYAHPKNDEKGKFKAFIEKLYKSLMKAGFSSEESSDIVIKYLLNTYNDSNNDLNNFHKKVIRYLHFSLYDAISSSFYWGESPERHLYWSNIAERLNKCNAIKRFKILT